MKNLLRYSGTEMELSLTGERGSGVRTKHLQKKASNVPSVEMKPSPGHGEKNTPGYASSIFASSSLTLKIIVGGYTFQTTATLNSSWLPHSNISCSESCATSGEEPSGFRKRRPNTPAACAVWARLDPHILLRIAPVLIKLPYR